MVSFKRFTAAAVRFSRWAMGAAFCLLVFIANVQPAAAFGSSTSKPSDGVVQLDKVEQQAKDVLKEGPRGIEDVTARAEGGINGVQGGVDVSKMDNPENSQDTATVKGAIKDAIEDLKG